MDNFFGGYLAQSQKTTITPKQIEFLKILQIPNGDLTQYIEEELMENPMLEADAPGECDSRLQIVKADFEDNKEGSERLSNNHYRDSSEYFYYAKNRKSLKEYLQQQLFEFDVDIIHRQVTGFLIESLDEDGYFKESVKETADILKVPVRTINECLKIIHRMEPKGVGARDLKECLLIQLKRRGLLNDTLKKIILNHLELLVRKNMAEIARKTGIDIFQVSQAFKLIKQLNPKPGASFSNRLDKFIIPDLSVVEISGKFYIQYNDELIPAVRINHIYKSLLKDPSAGNDTKDYIRKEYLRATNFVKAIEQRKKTILEIAEFIVDFQQEFLRKGYGHLKPLNMKTVAEALGVNESTVSRAVSGKHIQTPWGVYELKFFFPAGVGDDIDEKVSSVSIKDMIQKIISDEDKKKPLSDEKLKSRLEEKGVKVARRTIAKYREELSILPASMRKA